MVEPLRKTATGNLSSGSAMLSLDEIVPPAMINLRGSAMETRFLDIVRTILGCEIPLIPNRLTSAAGRTILWLGPDEWLILAEPDSETSLTMELGTALAGMHVSVVDVSGNRCHFRLLGENAREILEKGCSLDLHPRFFGPGRVAQTLLARAQVILMQREELGYDIFPRRSFAPYLRAWLEDAMATRRPIKASAS